MKPMENLLKRNVMDEVKGRLGYSILIIIMLIFLFVIISMLATNNFNIIEIKKNILHNLPILIGIIFIIGIIMAS